MPIETLPKSQEAGAQGQTLPALDAVAAFPDGVARLQRRLDRERRSREESENIAEHALADLYARQREVSLLQRVAHAANEAETMNQALGDALNLLCDHTGWPIGHAFLRGGSPAFPTLLSVGHWHLSDPDRHASWREETDAHAFESGIGLPGLAWSAGKPVWMTDITTEENFSRREMALRLGLRAGFALPIMVGGEVAAVMEFFTTKATPPDASLIDVLLYVGTQLGRVAERAASREMIRHQAYHDALTGLPNRSLFHDRLHQALSMSRRTGRGASILYLDLDRFKQINDTLGHAAGDALLAVLAGRMRAVLRAEDTLARMSGDEFTVLLPETGQADEALKAARRLLGEVARPVLLGTQEVFVSASIGVGLFPSDGEDEETLLRHTDAAMYRCKQQGGGCQLYTQEMDAAAQERLALETSLRQAVMNRELMLFYQPQVDAATGRVVGVEALVRWRHPTLDLVPPTRFIPLAEEIGLILPLGEWVLEEALRQAARWRREGHNLRMAVNVSARQFEQRDLPDLVAGALDKAGLPADCLELELTESVLMASGDGMLNTLKALKEIGIRLAVDDFGTGYSSLAYLRHFPVDVLKVDRAFVRGLGTAAVDEAIVGAVIDLAHALGLEVVAEGVETGGQRRILESLGCDTLQGFLFSKPCPAVEAKALLSAEWRTMPGGGARLAPPCQKNAAWQKAA